MKENFTKEELENIEVLMQKLENYSIDFPYQTIDIIREMMRNPYDIVHGYNIMILNHCFEASKVDQYFLIDNLCEIYYNPKFMKQDY